jgi:hypothetical protein
MSASEKIIERLQRVRQVAPRRWVASCPLHNTKGTALSIRELDDGRVLLHDFGGCETQAILSSIGLTVSDLFAETTTHHVKGCKPGHWHARKEAFETIHRECLLVAIAGETWAAGMLPTLQDRDRVCMAAQQIREAVEVCR